MKWYSHKNGELIKMKFFNLMSMHFTKGLMCIICTQLITILL